MQFINCTHTAIDSLDPDDITRGTIRLRRQAVEVLEFLKRHVPGFEDAYLAHVYDLGVRESRRIIGDYTLTLEDMISRREFEDVVAMGAYPPDLHDAHGGDTLIHAEGWSKVHADTGIPNNPGYQILWFPITRIRHSGWSFRRSASSCLPRIIASPNLKGPRS